MHGQQNIKMKKLIVVFRNIANAPKIGRPRQVTDNNKIGRPRQVTDNNIIGRLRQATDNNKIRRMWFASWIIKARTTPSEYVTLIAFLWQHWVRERALLILTVPVLLEIQLDWIQLIYSVSSLSV